MVRVGILLGVGILVVLPAMVIDAEGQPPADARVQHGRAIADSTCWACHVIGPDQQFSPILRDPGPDFRTIANGQDVTVESLTAFLRSPHRMEGKPYAMPNPRLTEAMIGDVASYILSLRDRR